MHILKLIFKNLLRHKLRSLLTMLGIAFAVLVFGFMRTVISSWNAGVQASQANRLVTVQSVSFIYPLPLSYLSKIQAVPGVREVSYANWFSGVYIDRDQFFARIAVEPETFFDVYPEFLITKEERDAFVRQRNACVIGAKTANRYHLKVGDLMTIEGDIYPGTWQMQVVGIYHGKDETVDETAMWFNWHYLDEQLKQTTPGRAGYVGWYIEDIADPNQRASISAAIDNLFANSSAETKTQTEKEFNQSFVSMSGAILTAINVVSFVIIAIILLILANTMLMAARERTREYAVLKTLGFSSGHLVGLIFGEAMMISGIGGVIGLALTFPLCSAVQKVFEQFFSVFNVEAITIILAISAALLAGIVSSAFPIQRAINTKIVDGLRQVG
jgi:putative ABC transport system permease protein